MSASSAIWILLLHAAATLAMFGVILIVQVVHYPLFGSVGRATYADYQRRHMHRITYVVFPLMLTELITAVLLVVDTPAGVAAELAWLGLVLLGIIWLSTALLQVPLHRRLRDGFDADTHRRLVATNWVRTGAWGLRSGIVLLMLRPLLRL